MTDVSVKSAKKKKRKLTSPNEKQRPSKTRRVDSSEKKKERREVEGIERLEHRERNAQLEEERPWRNLQLILLLQNKEVDIEKKVELAFHFVKALMRGGNSLDEDYETVKISRLIAFLSDWVQSLLISRDQKVKVEAGRNQSRVFEACLDFRCWDIFKFCLEESLKLHVSLNLSRNLLRAIGFISRNLLSLLHNKSLCLKESFFTDEGFETYGLVLDCVALLFSSRGGLMNENLDLWISTIGAVLELVHNIYAQNLEGHDVAAFVLKFSCLVLEPFAKFLRVHPTRKNGFRDFVDKLLDPLLHLLGVLHLEVNESAPGWTRNLIKLVQEVLSNGLFQPAHIDGFLGLHCTGKYVSSQDGKSEDIKMVLKSYHRHLFDKLESIMAAKKEMVLTSIGEIFHLLVDRVRKQKGALVQYEGGKIIAKPGCSKQMDNDLSSHISRNTSSGCSTLPEKSYCSSNLSGETRKSLFDFFVQLMEPLLLEMNGYILDELEIGVLSDIHCTLKCSNKLLSSLMREKIYVKTEDISNGACLNFLRKVYDMKVSVGCRLLQLAQLNLDNRAQEMFTLSAKELLVAVGYLLDIEYEVIGNDLVGLWLMVLSYLAIGHSSVDALGQSILTSDILGTGCQLVYLYSELRQVNNTIFALCKAVRLMTSHDADGEVTHTRFLSCTTSLPHEQIAKSVEALLVSQELKLAIHKAIKSIPEGQASGCIRQLMMDMSESMEWMKVSCLAAGGEGVNELNVRSSMLRFELQAEVLGRGLSEIYAVVLDSLTVTTGNSNLLGLAINDLMTVICPSMSSLVAPQSDRVKEFLFSVTGRNFDDMMADNKDKEYVVSTQWIIVFLFRLYISCRGLCRQIIGLMPPDSSKKMSAVMGDPFSACSGKDWMDKTDWTDDGYFSWIGQPSASLFDIIKSISDIYLRDKISYCYPLVYVLHTMALQRLVDLNRHINTLEYLLQSNDNLVQAKLFDADGLSKSRKRSRKLQRHILGLKQEAEYLTDFMIGYLSLVVDDQLPVSTNCHPTAHFLDASDKWDLVVSTINKKLLPVALWWILCQNIDIWCSHAATKKLKKFLSLLLRTSIPCVSSSSYMVGNHKMGETRKKKITVHQISSELLCDSILYEHKFVRRNLASRFCHILEESVLQLFDDFSTEDINFISSPNWPEVLSALNKLSVVVSGRKQVAHDSVKKSHSLSSSQLPTEICKEQGASGLTRMKFTACQNLLNLLCRMPKGYLNLKSFRIIATHILNLERVVIDSLLRCQATLSSHQQHELFRLFVSCRRTLKCVIMASCEEITGDILSSLLPIVPEGSSLVLWLFKSVYTVVGLQGALLEDSITESRHMIFSLMDNTSYVFLTISKYQFSRALHLFIAAKEPSKEQHSPSFSGEQKTSNEYDLCSDSSKGIEDCRNVLLAAESLKEQMQCLQITLKDAFRNDNARGVNVVSLNKLSSILSCLGGFLWGLSSAMNQIDPKKNVQKTFRWTCEPLSKLNICMDVFSDFVSVFLQLLFVEDDGRSRGLSNDKSSQKDFECSRDSGDVQSQNLGAVRAATASSNLDDGATRNSSLLEDIDSSVNVMTEVELGELQCLNKHFMHSLLKGDHPEAAYSLRQLLIVSSATLRFNLYMNGTPLSSSLVSIVVGISQVLLSGLVDMVEAPEPFSFVWLDGVLKYLEELGSHFPLTSHTLTRNVYSELIELHLRAIGKCISLQGKRATLASHETESSNKMFHGDIGLSEPSLSYGAYCLDEFKTRLRMSFKVFVEKSSELHLLSAIQAIERALVGVWEGCTTVYGIKTGNADGGKVSSTVGAGIDCLDLILEYVSGRKRLNVVKRHIQSLVAALFNVILHLRSPSIFYTESVSNKGGDYPDPGSVILMCIEVLTRVSGKHVLFQMDSWHIGQSIHIPAAIFCDLHQLITSGAAIAYNTSMFSDNQQHGHVTSMNYLVVDRQFSITLFAACCRLLYTVLKHHKSESEQCLAVLEESVSALLHSLETVDDDSVLRKGCFSWELEEGVKCACFLRRIYEELRQQKDVFGRHCFKFLSTYIWVYSGYGPLKMGIRREIDEALKPGVYALIDACSADDLQYLHTVFGEGPCRNNLATLQHDYKLNFQYGGKV